MPLLGTGRGAVASMSGTAGLQASMPATAFCPPATHLLFPAQTLRLGQLEETVIDRVDQGHHGHVVHLWGEPEGQGGSVSDHGKQSSLGLGTQAITAAQGDCPCLTLK